MPPNNPVLIIGGGIIGSSIAWRLAQQGIPVTVADAGNRGGEASPAAAGMLSPAAEADTASGGLKLGVESLRLYPQFIEDVRRDSGLDVEFRTPGCLMIGTGPGFPERKAQHNAAGLVVENHPQGLFYPEDGLVVPPNLLRAVRAAAAARGAIFTSTQEDRLETNSHTAVVVSAGSWSGALQLTCDREPVPLPRSIPVKGHLLSFRAQPGLLAHYIRKEAIYVLQRADGEVIAGSNEERAGFDTSVDENVCRALHQCAAELVPELAGLHPERQWIGFRPMRVATDHQGDCSPLMQQVEGTNVWLAYGHYRNGILLTPVTAQRVSRQIVEFLKA